MSPRVFCLSSRRLQDMSSRRKIRRIEDVFKTCLEDALKMSWRRLQDQQMFAGMGSDTPQIYYNLVKNAISFSFRHDIILIPFSVGKLL